MYTLKGNQSLKCVVKHKKFMKKCLLREPESKNANIGYSLYSNNYTCWLYGILQGIISSLHGNTFLLMHTVSKGL